MFKTPTLSIIKTDIVSLLKSRSLNFSIERIKELNESDAGVLYLIIRRLSVAEALKQDVVDFIFNNNSISMGGLNYVTIFLERHELLNTDMITLVKRYYHHDDLFFSESSPLLALSKILSIQEIHQLITFPHKKASIDLILGLQKQQKLTQEIKTLLLDSNNPTLAHDIIVYLYQNNLLEPIHIAILVSWQPLLLAKDPINLLNSYILIVKAFGEFSAEHQVLLENTQKPREAAEVLILLREKNLAKYQNLIFSSESSSIFDAVILLQKSNLLSTNTLELILKHSEPSDLAGGFISLNSASLLNEKYIDILSKVAKPKSVGFILSRLQQNNLLDEKNLRTVVRHAKAPDLVPAIDNLYRQSLLQQKTFDAVSSNTKVMACAHAICELHTHQILNTQNLEYLQMHHDPAKLASSLVHLHKTGILNLENQAFVATQPNPTAINNVLFSLKYKKLLNEANLAIIMERFSDKMDILAFILGHMKKFLTPDIIQNLFSEKNGVLLDDEAYEQFWSRIPQNQWNTNLFNRALVAVNDPNPIRALILVLRQILNVSNPKDNAKIINVAQSTHIVSIHQSASESARRIFTAYKSHKNLNNIPETLKAIQTLIHQLPGTHQNSAAKRAIDKLTQPNFFVDKLSGISLHQLLALAYTAIHDDSKRKGTLADALRMLAEGLYEIQRGYNLDQTGNDDLNEDKPICAGGTFNKIIEKLMGIHPDVSLIFMNRDTATSKFMIIIEQHAAAYLLKNRDEVLLQEMADEGDFSPIWESIKDGVTSEFWEEFKLLYEGNPHHHDLIGLLDSGPELSVSESFIEKIQQKLSMSSSATESSSSYVGNDASVKLEPSLKEMHAQQHVEFSNHHLMNADGQPNMSEYYEETDVQTLLRSRLSSRGDVAIVAALDPRNPGQPINQFIHDAITNHLDYQTQIIPIQLGNHWVGISINRNQHSQPLVTFYDSLLDQQRADYFQNLLVPAIETTLGEAIQWVIKPNTMVQEDATSCGGYLIENIVSEVLGKPVPSSNVSIRQLHLSIMRQEHPEIYAAQLLKASNCSEIVASLAQQGLFGSSSSSASACSSTSVFHP